MSDPTLAPEDTDAAPGPEAIRQQLERILASPQFASAPSIGKMLRFVVEHALDGTADRLKEYVLGVEVFGRGGDFDPRQDTIVRVQGRRLRDRLDDYYREQGVSDPVGIDLPKGHYVPTFHWRKKPPVPAPVLDGPDVPNPPQSQPAKPRPRLMAALGLVAVASLAFAATTWLRKDATTAVQPHPDTATATERPSLAVLPFADLSQAHDQEYLGDGLAEEIINQLAQVQALRMVGRTSSFSFKGKNEDLREIGRKLGVDHLLEGSVRKDGGQLRITTQLIRADDGTHLWSKTYARELRDVFAVQDEIARDVATALSVKLDVVTFNRERGGTMNVEAYERLLRWREIDTRELYDPEHTRESLQLAREMTALDPQCVLCWSMLGRSLRRQARGIGGVQAEVLRAEADQAQEKIARIAPDSWLAKNDRSYALWGEGRHAEAIAMAKQATDSGPTMREPAWPYSYMIYCMGYINETVTDVERIRAGEPLSLFLSRDLQFDYTAARRFDEAEAEYQHGLTLEGNQTGPHHVAFFRQLAGKRPGGLKELRELYRDIAEPDDPPFFRDLGEVLHDRDAMLVLVRKALADPEYAGNPEEMIFPEFVADALGDADLAVAALRKALEADKAFKQGHLSNYAYISMWNAPYSAMRAHPDFKKLLIETGVADYWRQTGKWGDGCKPVGKDDFQCQ